jgi:hypothetical protein
MRFGVRRDLRGIERLRIRVDREGRTRVLGECGEREREQEHEAAHGRVC